jgi:hypothetical protein
MAFAAAHASLGIARTIVLLFTAPSETSVRSSGVYRFSPFLET